jgi:predicted ribosomally synthesized peptide with SipW-like signal peptide
MNISRIVLGLVLIVGAGGALMGGTTAFFSDTESSTGNTFTAGAIDLKVDNESYYNGNKCAVDINDVDDDDNLTEFVWQGEATFPIPGTNCETSFPASDLDDGLVFFNFNDLKPDDEGEDTISLHVQNDAWACMDLTLTSNDDNGSNEPELLDDVADIPEDAWDGELGSTLEFFWWADDGDNVYEDDELQISNGVQSLIDLAPRGDSFSVPLADSTHGNVWGGEGPLPANETVYIAKAWCMGALTLDPVPEGQGVNPQVATGVHCDGTLLDNSAQTDSVELNVMFRAVQHRHNPDFICFDNGGNPEEEATLTVNKIIVASTPGIGVEDFQLHILGPDGDQVVSDNVPTSGLTPGLYTVSEVIIEAGLPEGVEFTTTFGGACDASGNVTLADLDNKVCTITNTEIVPEPIVVENFGTGTCLQDIPNWTEDPGNSCVNGTVAASTTASGDDTASPDGGRFALIGNNGYICHVADATGLDDLKLKYYWRGDSAGDVGADFGLVQVYTGGTCAAPTGTVQLASHDVSATSWSTLQTIGLPDSFDNTSFFIRFAASTNGGTESFRIDGVSLTGTPI